MCFGYCHRENERFLSFNKCLLRFHNYFQSKGKKLSENEIRNHQKGTIREKSEKTIKNKGFFKKPETHRTKRNKNNL